MSRPLSLSPIAEDELSVARREVQQDLKTSLWRLEQLYPQISQEVQDLSAQVEDLDAIHYSPEFCARWFIQQFHNITKGLDVPKRITEGVDNHFTKTAFTYPENINL